MYIYIWGGGVYTGYRDRTDFFPSRFLNNKSTGIVPRCQQRYNPNSRVPVQRRYTMQQTQGLFGAGEQEREKERKKNKPLALAYEGRQSKLDVYVCVGFCLCVCKTFPRKTGMFQMQLLDALCRVRPPSCRWSNQLTVNICGRLKRAVRPAGGAHSFFFNITRNCINNHLIR